MHYDLLLAPGFYNSLKWISINLFSSHHLLYAQECTVPLEPITCSFMHPLCLFTKETQLFLCSFHSFPKETKAWIFHFLTSCKVIPTDSLLQCLLLGKIQKLQNLTTNDTSTKKSWQFFCICYFFSLFYTVVTWLIRLFDTVGTFIGVESFDVAFATPICINWLEEIYLIL